MEMDIKLRLCSLLRNNTFRALTIILWIFCVADLSQASLWAQWWSYEGISGPSFWGRANPMWRLCEHGRQQSPINIQPNKLLFDPNLKNIKLEATVASGILMVDPNELTIEVKPPQYKWINITQGPLCYKYRVSHIKFHLANTDTHGSEHRIAGKAFPAEMQIIAYNSELYSNFTEASQRVKGLAIISVFIDITQEIHKSFYLITKELERIQKMQKNMTQVRHISIQHLLPKTKEYMTYEGSLSQPGCYETVTWMVMNKPLFIAKEQLTALRAMHQGSENEVGLPVQMNSRPVMPLNNRVVRTNINGTRKYRLCTMEKNMFYQVNTRYSKTIV